MGHKFHPQILNEKPSQSMLKKLAACFEGEIKAVVDIKRNIIAAGSEWHHEARDLLVKDGSDSDDLWGARVNIKTGAISFKSQINEGRVGTENNEITDQEVRSEVETMIQNLLL
ncbi:MAG: hypothetical protein HQK86_11020 [Nitrospinae bacterium]|nr:hypothetical protein [Nitrospinota bacterium]MBF0635050.1 hypothetical protein [Nitrospinota bacterium]